MTKLLQLLSIICLLFVGFGVHFAPNDPLFLLASGSVIGQILSGLLVTVLLVQFLTQPPRHLYMRIASLGVALLALGWIVVQINNSQIQLLDFIVFVGASISVTEAALERHQEAPTYTATSFSPHL